MKKTIFILLFLISSAMLLLPSCKKNKGGDGNNGYPKNATIEYRFTLVSGSPTRIDVSYTNESGGTENVESIVLPYSKKITRKVNAYDSVNSSFIASGPGAIKVELLIDGKVVDSKIASSNTTNSFTESTLYLWPPQ